MGEIFLARLEGAAGFEKLFVVKRILPHLADDARFRAMLIAEARIASKMSHANICQVYELGETDGQLYIVMEYLEGISLLPLLRRASKHAAPLDFGFVGGILQQTADALHYAHELRDLHGEYLGIVHRDVTPSNIFLTESGVTKVLDFGIAKVKDASTQTQTGAVKGKYAYMAPEQLRGGTIDRRADVFALGIVTFEMLALRRLFQRKTDYLTFRAVMEQPIPDVRRYRPDVPAAVADAIARALDRDPANRFATARQLASAMLDGLSTARRTWTQGEISDFVRSSFADDISRRREQTAGVVARSSSGAGRATMPLIAHDDGPPTQSDEDYEDDEFPAVEDTISDAPASHYATNPPVSTTEFQGITPPPFGGESSTSGASLQPWPSQGQPAHHTAPPAVAVPKRSVVWPMLAVGLLGIAGAALYLVWKQTQNQQPPPVVNIVSESATRPDAPDATSQPIDGPNVPAVATDAGPGDHVDDKSDDPKKPIRKKPPTGGSKYDVAIQAHKSRILKCALEHGKPPSDARVTIVVSTTGKAKTISFEPAKLNGSPLGACIKNVLSAASFPTASDEMKVSVALRAS